MNISKKDKELAFKYIVLSKKCGILYKLTYYDSLESIQYFDVWGMELKENEYSLISFYSLFKLLDIEYCIRYGFKSNHFNKVHFCILDKLHNLGLISKIDSDNLKNKKQKVV